MFSYGDNIDKYWSQLKITWSTYGWKLINPRATPFSLTEVLFFHLVLYRTHHCNILIIVSEKIKENISWFILKKYILKIEPTITIWKVLILELERDRIVFFLDESGRTLYNNSVLILQVDCLGLCQALNDKDIWRWTTTTVSAII